MCSSCYRKYGRSQNATKCPHSDRMLYSMGMCQTCYLADYHKVSYLHNLTKSYRGDVSPLWSLSVERFMIIRSQYERATHITLIHTISKEILNALTAGEGALAMSVDILSKKCRTLISLASYPLRWDVSSRHLISGTTCDVY